MDNQHSPPTIVEEKLKQQDGSVRIRTYQKGKFLGKGGFAKCYEFVCDETKTVYACKVVQKASLTKSRAKQKLMSEIKIHRSLKHQHVCHFQHFFEDAENVYILLEICQNQSLNDLLKRRKRLHELEVQCYTLQIISALKYLHQHRVIHRDLKLGNLFINDKMEVKVGDFGLAAKIDFDGERKRTICGTPNYIAPEVLEGKTGHSYEVDVWSLGVIIYTLIIGKPPFETTDVKTTYDRIKKNSYSFPDHVPISDAARELITRILSKDPARRPVLDEILNHDFLSQGSIPKTLPQSFLACPPTPQYIRQFAQAARVVTKNQNYQSASYLPRRIETQTSIVSPAAATGTDLPSKRLTAQGSSTQLNTANRAGVLNLNPPQAAVSSQIQNGISQRPATTQSIEPIDKMMSSGNLKNVASIPGIQSFPKMQVAAGSAHQIVKLKRPVSNNPSRPMSSKGGGTNGALSLEGVKQLSPKAQHLNQVSSTPMQSVWVSKWIDYSSKYGLGYLLSDNAAGVFFNDSTKIVVAQNDNNFYYYERRAVSTTEKQDVQTKYSFNDYPKELQKKVTLLEHFKSYLNQNKVQSSSQPENIEQVKVAPGSVYVKKWMRTSHATMFRLSNKIVQVNFKDRTEILLNSESRFVTYVNKKGERSIMPLSLALDSNDAEMTKRLKYTKDILTSMLNNGTGGNTNTNGQPILPGAPIASMPQSAAIGSRRSEGGAAISGVRQGSEMSQDRRFMGSSTKQGFQSQY